MISKLADVFLRRLGLSSLPLARHHFEPVIHRNP